jgi:HlyD family secretion protein
MKPTFRFLLPLVVALIGAGAIVAGVRAADDKAPPTAAPKPALTVAVVQPQPATLPLRVPANGNVAAWQDASIGAETNGLRLAEVRVNVGDVVRKGDLLATFASETVAAELAQLKAAVAEAEATLAEAAANAARARELQQTGALSAQQIAQYLTAERTAQARLEAQRAALKAQEVRLAQTRVVAPDAGVISARSATVGAVTPAGQGRPRSSPRPATAGSQARCAWSRRPSTRPPATASSTSTCRTPALCVPACSRAASSNSARPAA